MVPMFKLWLMLFFAFAILSSVKAAEFDNENILIANKSNIEKIYIHLQNVLDLNFYEPKKRLGGSFLACEDINDLKYMIDFEKNRLDKIKDMRKIEEIRPLTIEESAEITRLNVKNYLSTKEFNNCVAFFDPSYMAVTGEYEIHRNELIAEIVSYSSVERKYYILAIDLYKAFDIKDSTIDGEIYIRR